MEKIYNPASGRWVNRDGVVGKDVIKQYGDLSLNAVAKLRQFYVETKPTHKTKVLVELLDDLDYTGAIVFTKPEHTAELTQLLQEVNFPAMEFKVGKKLTTRLVVASEMDSAKNIYLAGRDAVINFDMSPDMTTYLRSIRHASSGLPSKDIGRVISFIASPNDRQVLEEVQKTFKLTIPPLSEPSPDEEPSDYI